jgi:hypothetical protein
MDDADCYWENRGLPNDTGFSVKFMDLNRCTDTTAMHWQLV